MKDRYATVLVCDDIRLETNGKQILIGVYNDIVLPAFPFELPKLHFKMDVQGRLDDPLKMLEFDIVFPGAEPVTRRFQAEGIKLAMDEILSQREPDSLRWFIRPVVTVQPASFVQEGRLVVTMRDEHGESMLARIRVRGPESTFRQQGARSTRSLPPQG